MVYDFHIILQMWLTNQLTMMHFSFPILYMKQKVFRSLFFIKCGLNLHFEPDSDINIFWCMVYEIEKWRGRTEEKRKRNYRSTSCRRRTKIKGSWGLLTMHVMWYGHKYPHCYVYTYYIGHLFNFDSYTSNQSVYVNWHVWLLYHFNTQWLM